MKTILKFILLSFAVLIGHAQPAAITASTRTINVNSNLVIVAPGTWAQIWTSNQFSGFTFQMNTNTTAAGVRTHLGLSDVATATGTAGYFPYFNVAGTGFGSTTNIVYTDGLKVGVNTNAPLFTLDVNVNNSGGVRAIRSTAAAAMVVENAVASPGANAGTGSFVFVAQDSAANRTVYGQINGHVTSSTDGAESGYYAFTTIGSGAIAERMRLDHTGNLLVGTSTGGTSAAKVLVLGSGTEPSTSPADTIQIWSGDVAGGGDAGLKLRTEGSAVYQFGTNSFFPGRLGVGGSTPTAWLHLKAGESGASSAPLKIPAGTLMATPEDGAIESDGASVYATFGSTRRKLVTEAGSETVSSVQVDRLTRKSYAVVAGDGTVLINSWGDAITVSGGSQSWVAPTTTSPPMVQWATGASSGDAAYFASRTLYYRRARTKFAIELRLSATTSIRAWVGFSDTAMTSLHSTDDPGSANLAMFRYSTVAGDSNWMAATKDGTTLGTSDSGVAPTTSPMIFVGEFTDANTIRFRINGSTVATRTTTLPSASNAMACGVAISTQTAATRDVDFAWVELDQGSI